MQAGGVGGAPQLERLIPIVNVIVQIPEVIDGFTHRLTGVNIQRNNLNHILRAHFRSFANKCGFYFDVFGERSLTLQDRLDVQEPDSGALRKRFLVDDQSDRRWRRVVIHDGEPDAIDREARRGIRAAHSEKLVSLVERVVIRSQRERARAAELARGDGQRRRVEGRGVVVGFGRRQANDRKRDQGVHGPGPGAQQGGLHRHRCRTAAFADRRGSHGQANARRLGVVVLDGQVSRHHADPGRRPADLQGFAALGNVVVQHGQDQHGGC